MGPNWENGRGGSPWSLNNRPRPSFGAGQSHGGGWTGGGGIGGGLGSSSGYYGGGWSGGGGGLGSSYNSGYHNSFLGLGGGSKPWFGLGNYNNGYGYGNRFGYNQRAEAGHMFL